MFDRAACPDKVRFSAAPFVSVAALSALSRLFDQALRNAAPALHAEPSDVCPVFHEENPGEVHGAGDDDASDRDRSQRRHAPRLMALFKEAGADGIADARVRGKHPGRRPREAEKIAAAIQLVKAGLSPTAAARQRNLGRSTIYREINRAGIARGIQTGPPSGS